MPSQFLLKFDLERLTLLLCTCVVKKPSKLVKTEHSMVTITDQICLHLHFCVYSSYARNEVAYVLMEK